MFRTSTVRLDKDLLARVRRHADAAGYSSAEEFIVHVLEKELAHLDEAQTDDEMRRRLKGLGYLS